MHTKCWKCALGKVRTMIVTLTQEAEERFLTIAGDTPKPIRINGELVGGCGMTVEYALWWDEILPTDQTIAVGTLALVVDKETVDYIASDKLVIDYRAQQGFRLVTPEQILAYGLQVKERWA